MLQDEETRGKTRNGTHAQKQEGVLTSSAVDMHRVGLQVQFVGKGKFAGVFFPRASLPIIPTERTMH